MLRAATVLTKLANAGSRQREAAPGTTRDNAC